MRGEEKLIIGMEFGLLIFIRLFLISQKKSLFLSSHNVNDEIQTQLRRAIKIIFHFN